jgi:hypothetical protein
LSKIFSSSYLLINLILFLIIFLILLYSAVFSAKHNNYPIRSNCIEIMGKPCISTGLSRSFSEMVRGNFHSAYVYNPNGPIIFSFIVFQIFFRVVFSILYSSYIKSSHKIITIDIILSIIIFLIAFRNFIYYFGYAIFKLL